jgi:hypothetical protein
MTPVGLRLNRKPPSVVDTERSCTSPLLMAICSTAAPWHNAELQSVDTSPQLRQGPFR